MSADSSPVAAAARTPPPPAQATANTPPARPAPAAASQGPAPTATHAVKLRPPEKVDIGFDAREMRRQLEDAIQQLNDQAQRNSRDLNFRVDDVVDRTVITVRSKHTGEVVRQIPSETVLKVAHNIEDMKGLLWNESA